jgi:hypothetical protein
MATAPRARQLASELRALGGVLGFLGEDPGKFCAARHTTVGTGEAGAPALPGLSDAEIDKLAGGRGSRAQGKGFRRIGPHSRISWRRRA